MTFEWNGKNYELTEDLCTGVFNDEDVPMREMEPLDFLKLLTPKFAENLDLEYYEDPCENCPPVERKKKELVPYLEGHFYLFTKKGEPVMSTLDPAYEATSYELLVNEGKVDESYVVSVVICPDCGEYQVILDQVEM